MPEYPIPEAPIPEYPIPEEPMPEYPIPEEPMPEYPIPEAPGGGVTILADKANFSSSSSGL